MTATGDNGVGALREWVEGQLGLVEQRQALTNDQFTLVKERLSGIDARLATLEGSVHSGFRLVADGFDAVTLAVHEDVQRVYELLARHMDEHS
jgi:hypothetical protein